MNLQLTNQVDYAIRAMAFLAESEKGKWIPSSMIAEEMEISRMFLSRINMYLGRAGLIRSQRGAKRLGGIVDLLLDAAVLRPAGELGNPHLPAHASPSFGRLARNVLMAATNCTPSSSFVGYFSSRIGIPL